MVANTIKKISKGAILIIIGTVFGGAIEFFVRSMIERTLGHSQFGIYNLGYAIVGIAASLALLGFPQAVARFIPCYE